MQQRITSGLGATMLTLATVVVGVRSADASYAFYVGKNLSRDGTVLVGGTGEEVSSHWLTIVPQMDHAEGAKLEVGITAEANIPGERFLIAQPRTTYRYISMHYSDFEGFPPPLTNGGINEHQVVVRDVWAPCRAELVAMTPKPQHGLSYSDLARLVLERARTAREGVRLIGELIARHGYATYGGNTHLIADTEEAWVVWEMAGGQGLWAAERLGPDDVRVLYPGHIGRFPLHPERSRTHMGSDNLLSFAREQGWYRDGQPFDLWAVYGVQGKSAREGDFKFVGPSELESELRRAAPLSEREMLEFVRDRRIADDEAGYGFVTAAREGVPVPLIRAWVAPTGSVTAPFLPWWMGVTGVPLEYAQHRYLTRDAAATFLAPSFQAQEASEFAGRLFKRVLYYTCLEPAEQLPWVQSMLRDFERGSRKDVRWVESAAATLLRADKRPEAHALLTHYAHARAHRAMDLGRSLVDLLRTRLELRAALRPGPRAQSPNASAGATVHCLGGKDPDRPARGRTP